MPEWLRLLLAAAKPLIPRGFYGCIEIHVFDGGIATANVRQSFKEKECQRPSS